MAWNPLAAGEPLRAPPGPEGWGFEAPELEFPAGGVEVPQRIVDGFAALGERFIEKLGFDVFGEMMRPVPGRMNQLCIENPFREFNGFQLPAMRGCLDFDELAQQEWVPGLRRVLLFMIVMMFVISIIVTLRQY